MGTSKPTEERLASLFQSFALDHELPHRVGHHTIRVAVPVEGRIVHVAYTFYPSGDSYDLGAVLATVPQSEQARLAHNVLTSEAMRGVTERLHDDRFLILSSRDGLQELGARAILKLFEDDLRRVAIYSGRLDDLQRG